MDKNIALKMRVLGKEIGRIVAEREQKSHQIKMRELPSRMTSRH